MSQPLFDTPTHLSEMHISPAADALFLTGETLAIFNAGGQFFYPDFLKDLKFDRNKGKWMIIKTGNRHEAKPDPEIASWQFRGPVSEGSTEILGGLLGGYARQAYKQIDPIYPGFTDALLKYLVSGPILSVTKPRALVLDLPKILANYGLGVNFKTVGPSPQYTQVPVVACPCSDLELVVATMVLTLAELDPTTWIEQVERLDSQNKMAQLLAAIVRREYKSDWDGLVAELFELNKAKEAFTKRLAKQPASLLTLLQFVIGIYELYTLPADRQIGQPFEIYKYVMHELEQEATTDWVTCAEAVIDSIYYLAQLADEEGNVSRSIYLDNLASVTMQMLAREADGMENRLARMELNKYSWQNKKTTTTLDKSEILKYVNTITTRSLNYNKCFATSLDLLNHKKITNPLWTAHWQSRNHQRNSFKLLHALQQQADTWEKDFLEPYFICLRSTFNIYLECQKQLASAIASPVKPGGHTPGYGNLLTVDPKKDKNNFIELERTATIKLHSALQNKSSQNIKMALQELVSVIKEVE